MQRRRQTRREGRRHEVVVRGGWSAVKVVQWCAGCWLMMDDGGEAGEGCGGEDVDDTGTGKRRRRGRRARRRRRRRVCVVGSSVVVQAEAQAPPRRGRHNRR